jgi:hypothetical protein
VIGGQVAAISRFNAMKSRHTSGTLSSWKIASTGHSRRHASQSVHASGTIAEKTFASAALPGYDRGATKVSPGAADHG